MKDKLLDTLDQHLRAQNARRTARGQAGKFSADGQAINRRPTGYAPVAPFPSDNGICRWCGGALIALISFEDPDYCQNGCAKNDQAAYLRDCHECQRPFETGRPSAMLCYFCEKAATDRATAEPSNRKERYRFNRYGRGGYRG